MNNGFNPLAALVGIEPSSFMSTSISSRLGEDGQIHTKVRKNVNGEITEDSYTEACQKAPVRARKEVCSSKGYPPADLIENTADGTLIARILVAAMDESKIKVTYNDDDEAIHVVYAPEVEKSAEEESFHYLQRGIKNRPFEIAYFIDLKKYDPKKTSLKFERGVLEIVTQKNENHVSRIEFN